MFSTRHKISNSKRKKHDKLSFTKIKIYMSLKETLLRKLIGRKRLGEVFMIHIFDKELISIIYRELL